MQHFDVETKTWKPVPSMVQLTEATECCCAEYVGNYLYVAAKKGNDFVNYRYHTVSNSWETLPPVLSHDDFFSSKIGSLCFLDNFLYAISGRSTCVPFRYSPAENSWQGGANLSLEEQLHNSNNRLTKATATVWKSHIYVLHGVKKAKERKMQSNSVRRTLGASSFSFGASVATPASLSGAVSHGGHVVSAKLTSQVCVDKAAVLHLFDPKTNQWKQLSSTCSPHCNSGLFVVNNRLFAAGGCTHNSQRGLIPPGSASVEVYDDGDDTWSVVKQKHISLNNLGAVEIEGRFYFMVNKFPVDVDI